MRVQNNLLNLISEHRALRDAQKTVSMTFWAREGEM
jgi:hypothetical protein